MPSPSEAYKKLEPDRSPFERRAEKCAALSIPYLFPRGGSTASDDFPTPFQSNAAGGVNTMSSAISLSLFPPGVPFYRNEIDGLLENELRAIQSAYEQAGRPERPLEDVKNHLAAREREVVKEIERKNYRVGVYDSVRSLLVVGNSLLEHLDEGGLRVHPLRAYVVRRNPDASPAEIVIHEQKGAGQLTEEEKDAIKAVDWAFALLKDDSKVDIYTHVTYADGRYEVVQQVGSGRVLEDQSYGGIIEDCPFLPLRFIRTPHEHYGRSFVEEYFGDIASLDTSQQSVVEAGALAAKVLFMVDPASGISPKALSTAANGAFRSGRADQVSTLQVGKQADMSVTFQIWERLAAQVNRAFSTPEVRNAERVTAAEIQFLQQQLERNLGGVFPLLALDLQMPMALQITKRLAKRGVIPEIPMAGKRRAVEPVIVTGIQALGRSTDAEKLLRVRAAATTAMGPEAAAQRFDDGAWLNRLFAAEGIDPQGVIRTDAQIAAMNEAAQKNAIQERVASGMVDAGGRMLTKATPEGSLEAA